MRWHRPNSISHSSLWERPKNTVTMCDEKLLSCTNQEVDTRKSLNQGSSTFFSPRTPWLRETLSRDPHPRRPKSGPDIHIHIFITHFGQGISMFTEKIVDHFENL